MSPRTSTSQRSESEEELQKQIQKLQLGVDLLKETMNVLKKDPGADMTSLSNREKAVVVGALKEKYALPILLEKLNLPRSSYFYQSNAINRKDKYATLRCQVKEIFYQNKTCYGYRRIWFMLKRQGVIISEKIIRRIMREEMLKVPLVRKKKYNSYQGEISPEVDNVIARDFHAKAPNEKWLSDITKFAIPAGKVYLSPMIDCFDGFVVRWTLSTAPKAELVNSMLDAAISALKKQETPLIHTDRGCHYRWPGWIERLVRGSLDN